MIITNCDSTVRPHATRSRRLQKNLHFGDRVETPPFSVPEDAVNTWTEVIKRGKNLHSQKYPDTCKRRVALVEEYRE